MNNSGDKSCHWCDKTDQDNEEDGYGSLVDFRMVVARGEEGYSNILRYACQEHHIWLVAKLHQIGFSTHAHGGICFLEAPCVENAYENCPHPELQYWE